MEVLKVLELDKKNRHENGELFVTKIDPKLAFIFNIRPYVNNTLIAGGFAWDYTKARDIDIFIYGDCNPHEVLKELVKDIDEDTILRTKKFVQFDYLNLTWQIILRHYKTKAEILYGFDLGCSQCGFDDKNYYSTHLNQFAQKYKTNIVVSSRASPSYFYRLVKYYTCKQCNYIFPWGDPIILIGDIIHKGFTSQYDHKWGYNNYKYWKDGTEEFLVKGFNYPLSDFRSKIKCFNLESFKGLRPNECNELKTCTFVPPIEFMTENPGTQMTSSFNPLDINQWDYYINDYVNNFYPLWSPEIHHKCANRNKYKEVYIWLWLKGLIKDLCILTLKLMVKLEVIENIERQMKRYVHCLKN